jgi:hypothetical protein
MIDPLTGLPTFGESKTVVVGRGGGVPGGGSTTDSNAIPKPSIITESGTTRTLALTDEWDYIRLTHATSCDLTVPDNTDVAFPVGTQVFIRSGGAGTYTILEDTAVTVNPPVGGSLVLAGDVTLIKVATDEWDLVGATV